jgi:ribonuclease HI
MTYDFPQSLHPLRDFLKKQGFAGDAVKTSRQAAFVAQQLLGTRIKFPPQGQDMTPTLLSIQEAVKTDVPTIHDIGRQKATKGDRARLKKGEKIPPYGKKANYQKHFTPELFAKGIHIFCDGAAVPNPGLGGWGVAVYEDGVEIDNAHGGELESTNNIMELTAILSAIGEAWKYVSEWGEVTIWSDSQYCVRGVNEWRQGWKKNGWQRGGDKAEPKNRILMNADLWMAIDKELDQVPQFGKITIKWVKGHIGVAGNERADELAEMGRQEQHRDNRPEVDDLDERYRQIMGAL